IADGDIVNFRKAQNCSVRFCRIENARECGIEILDHAQNIVIYGNVIRRHGLHGVALSGRGPGREDVNHHNIVENNHIHHCGRLIGHGYGVRISQSGQNRIVHNHIHHMPRYAATIKGKRYQILKKDVKGVTWENRHDFLHSRKNLIAFNDIHHVNQDSQDTGAIESWGPGRDNTIDHNLIHNVGNDKFNIQSGIYLDDAVDYFTVTNNIIYGVTGTSGNQCIYAKGIGNRIENNILIVDRTNTSAIRSFFMADERCDHHEYVRNIIYFQNRDDVPSGGFDAGVSNIHTKGNSLTWKINSPAPGHYDVWLRYASSNLKYGAKDMGGRYGIETDSSGKESLNNLPDTGGWGIYKWSRSASIKLDSGQHTLRMENLRGGGIVLDAIALCNDKAWQPTGSALNEPADGKHLIVVQAESFRTKNDKGRRADIYDFNNWSDDRVSASDYNIFWNGGDEISVKGGPANGSFEKWRQLQNGKFDRNSITANPMFVDAANRDYRLKSASPALKMGFKPIDMSTVGLKADFPARFERD
ncbi:MAG: right-handed parallel beta-helix repeat-containing protein, partial [Planctomycetes bacterium]|nr:right-handed parallel beta-helix repeat-containing protein [Planctomycetota bacterium]